MVRAERIRCTVAPVKKGGLAVGGIAILIVGAIVVSSSIGAGGGKGPYHFHSGVFVRDQGSFVRLYVENLTSEELTVKVKFSTQSGAESLAIPADGQAVALSQICNQSACEMRGELISKSPLIAPTLRYVDTDGAVQENRGGAFVVIRDGKRLW